VDHALGRRRRAGSVVQRYWVPLGLGPDPLEVGVAFAQKPLVVVDCVRRRDSIRIPIVGDKDEGRTRRGVGELGKSGENKREQMRVHEDKL